MTNITPSTMEVLNYSSRTRRSPLDSRHVIRNSSKQSHRSRILSQAIHDGSGLRNHTIIEYGERIVEEEEIPRRAREREREVSVV
jgi:hypothetical protein